MQMWTGFLVDEKNVCASMGKVGEIPFRFNNHQVHIERQSCALARGFDNQWTNSDIRDKATIHHIHMNSIGSRTFDFFNLLS